MKIELNLLDVVALLKDIPERNLIAGQVGTVVEFLEQEVYEIEFCNREGKTITTIALPRRDLLKLHYEQMVA